MRNLAILGFLLLAATFLPVRCIHAYTFEIHPGAHTAYEYTDNYLGTARDAKSEGIYEIGPSLGLNCISGSSSFTLDGYVSRGIHNRFDKDDSTEANLITQASLSQVRQTFGLSYGYSQSRIRGTLAEPAGEVKRNTGGATYTREMTQRTSVSVGYDITKDDWQAPHEDETAQAGNIRLSYLLTPRNTIDLTYIYDNYDYQTSQDANVSNAGLAWWYAATPRLRLGLNSSYRNEDRGRLSNEDIYDLSVTGNYSIAEHTSLSASGGRSWLVMKHHDRQDIYTMAASLEHSFERDRLALSVSKGYTAEFTNNLYGIYDTRSLSLSLEKEIVSKLAALGDLSYGKTMPVAGTEGQEEADTVASASLRWRFLEDSTATATYEHLQHGYEITDTVRENRYRINVEVRY